MVISYIRWSSAIQGDGDSYRRQKKLADEWCAKNGLTLAPEHVLTDAGLSAYKGKNLSEGAFGAFLKAVNEGKFPAGTFLLVENLDRISRQHPMAAMSILHQIVEAGIVVVTLGGNVREYRKPLDLGQMFQAIIDLSNAHVESDKKRERTTANWQKKHADLISTGLPMGSNLPAWLSLSGDKRSYIVDEEKAELIRSIFDWSISGLGLPAIAKKLNAAGIKPWAMQKRKSWRCEYWTVASVNYLLTSKAVYGTFYSPKLKQEIPERFPPIVSVEDFHRAQAAKLSRLKSAKGRKGNTYSNLFSGRAYCSFCGEPMTIRHPKRGRATQFYCKGTLNGMCRHRPWNYNVFEESFLSLVNELDMQSVIHGGHGSRLDTVTKELQALEGKAGSLQKSLDAFTDMIRKNPVLAGTLTSAMVTDQTELDAVKASMKAKEQERVQIQSGLATSQEGIRVKFPTDIERDELYQLRAKAAQHIRTLVDRIELERQDSEEFVSSSYRVQFVGGGERTVFVNYSNPRKPFAVTGDPKDSTDYVYSAANEEIGVLVGNNVKGMYFANQKP